MVGVCSEGWSGYIAGMQLENWQWAILIKPFVAFVFIGLIAYPIRVLVQRKMPEGRLKRLLLLRLSK